MHHECLVALKDYGFLDAVSTCKIAIFGMWLLKSFGRNGKMYHKNAGCLCLADDFLVALLQYFLYCWNACLFPSTCCQIRQEDRFERFI